MKNNRGNVPTQFLVIPFQSLAVKLGIVYVDLQRLVTITLIELTNIQILSKKEVNRGRIKETERLNLSLFKWLINFLLRCPR